MEQNTAIPLEPAVTRQLGTRKYLWMLAAAWSLIVYLAATFLLRRAATPEISMYLLLPMLWSMLFVIALLGWKFGLKENEKPAFDQRLLIVAGCMAVAQLAAFFIAGVVFGFGRSPYSHRLGALMGNLLYAGTMLVGVEMCRALILAVFKPRWPLAAVLLTTLYFSFLSIPFPRFTNLGDPGAVIQTTGGLFLPTLSENLLAGFLALYGGPLASIAYRGALEIFEWLPPILPDLKWYITAILGTIIPVMGVVWVSSLEFDEDGGETAAPAAGLDEKPPAGKAASEKGQSLVAWAAVALISVGILWLNTGLLGVRPILIASGSMEPVMHVGDVILSRNVRPGSVEVGDIVCFRHNQVDVIHRVIHIEQNGEEITFTTRGDNNNVDDPPWSASELRGKAVFTIPKVGWISIGMRSIKDLVLGLFR